ncbi:MAG: hypothetical protein ABUL72_05925, partial [Armatimonadota bacterium]
MPATLVAPLLIAAASAPKHQTANLDLKPQLVSAPPKIDGIIDDAEWAGVEKQTTPWFNEQTGTPCEEKAEFWIAYDGKALYYAGRAHTDPHKLLSDEFRQ